MPNPGTLTNNRIIFWDHIAASAELREKYKDIIDRLNAGELTGLHFHELGVSNPRLKGTSSVYTGYGDRLIITPIPGTNSILILGEVKNHQYPPYLQDASELEQRVENTLRELKPEDYIPSDGRAFAAHEKPAAADAASAQIRYSLSPTYYNNRYCLLTDEQSQSLELNAPFMVFAEAGFGKTLYASEYLRKIMLRMKTSPHEFEMKAEEASNINPPVIFSYVAKNKKLVGNFREQHKAHPAYRRKCRQGRIQIWNLEDLCRANWILDTPAKFANYDSFAHWLMAYKESWRDQEKARTIANHAKGNFHEQIFENPELIYKELAHMVVLSREAYLQHGIAATKGYFNEEERRFLWDLLQNYLKRLEEAKEFDLSLNPPPLKKSAHYCMIVDESQILSPKEIVLLRSLVSQEQIIWLYGRHQSLNFCNRQYFSALNIPHVTFNKNFRNPWEVTMMANNLTRIELLFGNSDSPEYQPKSIEPNLTKSGKICWGSPEEIPAEMKAGTDSKLRIVTPKEYVDEAKKLFKTELVYTPEQIQGSDCENLVLYKMLSHPIFASISSLMPNTEIDPSGNKPKTKLQYEQKSEQKVCVGEIQSSCETLHMALTRSTNKVFFIEDHPSHSRSRTRFVEELQKGIPISPLKEYQGHTSTPEEWLSVIEQEYQKGNVSQAVEALGSLLKKFPEKFTAEDIAEIKKQLKEGKAILRTKTAVGTESKTEPKTEEKTEAKDDPRTTAAPSTATLEGQASNPDSEPTINLYKVAPAIIKKYAPEKLVNVQAMISLLREPNFEKIFYLPLEENKPSLMRHILVDNPEKAEMFKTAFMKSAKNLGKIPEKFQTIDLIRHCLYNQDSLDLLAYLLEKLDNFAQNISRDTLFLSFNDAPKTTSYFMYCKSLFQLLNKNRALLTGMPINFLIEKQYSRGLAYFAQDSDGIRILDLICDYRPDIVRTIPLKKFEKIVPRLGETSEGRKILGKMVNLYPILHLNDSVWGGLGQKISTKSWLSCQKVDTGSHTEYHLHSTSVENEIFDVLPLTHKEYIFRLPEPAMEILYALLDKDEKTAFVQKAIDDILWRHPDSFFAFLASDELFLAVVKQQNFYKKLAKVPADFFIKALTARPKYRGVFQNLSCQNGIIHTIISNNMQFAEKMPWYYWILDFNPCVNSVPIFIDTNSFEKNKKMFDILPKDIQDLLKHIIEISNPFTKDKPEMKRVANQQGPQNTLIFDHIIDRDLAALDDILMDHPKLHNLKFYEYVLKGDIADRLFETRRGSCIFKKMIDSPSIDFEFFDFLNYCPLETLKAIFDYLMEPYPHDPEGMPVLFHIVSIYNARFPAISGGIFVLVGLTETYKGRIGSEWGMKHKTLYQQDAQNSSLFFLMASNKQGIAMLSSWLAYKEIASLLFKNIPKKALYGFVKEANTYVSAANKLANTDILNKCMEEDPSVVEDITAAMLCKAGEPPKKEEVVQASDYNSLLYELCLHNLPFFLAVARQNPWLFWDTRSEEVVPKKAWFETSSKANNSLFKAPNSAIRVLAYKKNGICVYQFLSEEIKTLFTLCAKEAIKGSTVQKLLPEIKPESKDGTEEAEVEIQALALFKKFDQRRLQFALSNFDFKELFLKTYTSAEVDGGSFSLIDRLYTDEACRMAFSSCLLNSLNLLSRVPLETVPPFQPENQLSESWNTWFKTLKSLRDFFLLEKTDQVKKKLETETEFEAIPLIHHVIRDDFGKEYLRQIKACGGDFNLSMPDGTSAAQAAVQAGFLGYLPILKDFGTDFMRLDAKGQSLWHTAVGCLEDVKDLDELIRIEPRLKTSLRIVSKTGQTPAYNAIIFDKPLMLEKILTLDPSFNLQLMHSILGENKTISKYTILHIAILLCRVDCIKVLKKISPQLSLTKTLEDGHTPLHCAALKGEVTVLDLLLEWDPKMPLTPLSLTHLTPALLAARMGHAAFLRALKKHDETLPINQANELGTTPVLLAIKSNDENMLRTLYDLKVRLNDYKRTDGLNLGIEAVKTGNIAIIKLLVDMQYDMDIPMILRPNDSLLAVAEKFGHKENDKLSPYLAAQYLGKTEVANYIHKILQKPQKTPTKSSDKKSAEPTFFIEAEPPKHKKATRSHLKNA